MDHTVLLERSYFLTQIPGITASVKYREAEIAMLKRLPTQQQSSGDHWRWFDEFSKGHPDLAEVALQLERTRSIRTSIEETDVHDDGSPLLKLADEVDQLRKELKYLYTRNDHLESLRNTLAYFRSGAKNYGLNVDEFAVYEMLNRGSKAAKRKCKEFLESMGYPVDGIVAKFEC